MWPVVAGLSGAAFTALVTLLLGRRTKSGRIETSEAKDLWETMKSELARRDTENIDLRARVAVQDTEIEARREESVRVRIENAKLMNDIANLRAQLEAKAK